MWGYRGKLERDLVRWRDAGWITPSGETSIRADLASRRGIGLPGALAILAAVLIGFAVMSFVAANWQAMPRPLRLGLLLGLLWLCYGFAGALFQRGMDVFGHAAVLAGASVFGASIMLISQMYHMDGNAPDAVWLWGVGAFLAAALFRSNATFAFALVLFSVWGIWESVQRGEVFWPYLLPWAAVSAAFAWQRWAPGAHLSGLGLVGFIISLGYHWHSSGGHEIVVAAGVVMAAIALIARQIVPQFAMLFETWLVHAFITVFAGLWALQFFVSHGLNPFILLAVIALAATLAAIWWGLLAPDRLMLWLGYAGFSAEILGIYGKTIGTMMGSSVFFLTAGLIVAALAYLAYRLHARNEPQEVRL